MEQYVFCCYVFKTMHMFLEFVLDVALLLLPTLFTEDERLLFSYSKVVTNCNICIFGLILSLFNHFYFPVFFYPTAFRLMRKLARLPIFMNSDILVTKLKTRTKSCEN